MFHRKSNFINKIHIIFKTIEVILTFRRVYVHARNTPKTYHHLVSGCVIIFFWSEVERREIFLIVLYSFTKITMRRVDRLSFVIVWSWGRSRISVYSLLWMDIRFYDYCGNLTLRFSFFFFVMWIKDF